MGGSDVACGGHPVRCTPNNPWRNAAGVFRSYHNATRVIDATRHVLGLQGIKLPQKHIGIKRLW